MSTLWKDIRYKLMQSDSKLGLLIAINIAVYLIVNIPATFEVLFLKSGYIYTLSSEYLSLSANFKTIATHFWTPFTYMFMHAPLAQRWGILHIIFNMVWLYWMGQIFEEFLGKKRTITLYILGGLAGAVFFIGGIHLIPFFSDAGWQDVTVIGASASVMAFVVATSTLLPNYEIFLMFLGPVKLKWLAIVYVIIDFMGTIGPNAGGELAHLGGALIGFIYIKQLQKGNDWSTPINKMFTPKPKIKVVQGGSSGGTRNSSANTLPRQDEVDRILDKISQSGYDSLSKQEKETLFRASNNDR